MTKHKSEKQRFHVALRPEVAKNLKLTAVKHDIYPGDVVAAGLLVLETLPPAQLAALLAGYDDQHGHAVLGGEAEAVAEARNDQAIRATEIEAATKESD